MRKLLAAALAASLGVGAGQGWGQEAPKASPTTPAPSRLQIKPQTAVADPATNQRVADAIAARLYQSPLLKNFRVTISVENGHVELGGSVVTSLQRVEALNLTYTVPGVVRVHDHIAVALSGDVVQAQVAAPAPVDPLPLVGIPAQGDKLPKVIGAPPGQPDPKQPMPQFFPPVPQGYGPMGPFPPPPQGFGPGGPGAPPGFGGILEPMPIQGGPPGFPSATQPPPLPPYAWSTYAPYNNYSRVAYPNLYPYESFPFIGPFYPFPKVPLGWRSVTLSWEDGHWWLARNATGHDWWRVRYW